MKGKKGKLEIEATYRVTTPMYCSGFEQKEAEIRLPSFKGVLQFWWRALAWRRYQNLDRLRQAEEALFGSSARGQSALILSLRDVKAPRESNPSLSGEGLRYLGYGLREQSRGCISPGATFTVSAFLRDDRIDPETRDDLRDAFEILGLLGGMGSKSRKGFGSLTLLELAFGDEPRRASPTSADGLRDRLRDLIPLQGEGLPPYTAFSSSARVVVADHASRGDAVKLLDTLCKAYREAGIKTVKSKARAAFGVPRKELSHPLERRASPIFLHIHHPLGATPLALATFMPSDFDGDGHTRASFFRPADDFMSRLGSTPLESLAQAPEVSRG